MTRRLPVSTSPSVALPLRAPTRRRSLVRWLPATLLGWLTLRLTAAILLAPGRLIPNGSALALGPDWFTWTAAETPRQGWSPLWGAVAWLAAQLPAWLDRGLWLALVASALSLLADGASLLSLVVLARGLGREAERPFRLLATAFLPLIAAVTVWPALATTILLAFGAGMATLVRSRNLAPLARALPAGLVAGTALGITPFVIQAPYCLALLGPGLALRFPDWRGATLLAVTGMLASLAVWTPYPADWPPIFPVLHATVLVGVVALAFFGARGQTTI